MSRKIIKTRPWDSAERLETEDDIAEYFEACLREGGGDHAFIAHALSVITRARGMAQVARDTGKETNMSRMHNPPHPGEVLREWIPPDVSVTQAAHALQINRVTLSNLLNGKAGITANLALRLSTWLGTTPEHWLGMQTQWDLWQARQQPRPRIRPLARPAA